MILPDSPMEAAAAPALRRQLSYNCSRGRCEPMHDQKLSHSYSFSSAVTSLPQSSPASSTTSSRSCYHAAMSNKSSSCDSIPAVDVIVFPAPAPELEKQYSSASSYESFIQLEAADLNRISDAAATQPPAVQTMSGGGYDPGSLPSSMFRTQSMSPTNDGAGAGWSFNSSESLFSIQLSHSGDISGGDIYYDAAASEGSFRRVPSARHDLPAVEERSSSAGGLCVSESCARCSSAGGGKTRKSVRFASADEIVSVFGDSSSNHSHVFTTLADALGEARAAAPAPATEGKETAAAQGWCAFRCCWPTPPSVWWPRCACRGGGGGCSGVFGCGDYCRC